MDLESLIQAIMPEDKTKDLFELINDLLDEYLGTCELFSLMGIPTT